MPGNRIMILLGVLSITIMLSLLSLTSAAATEGRLLESLSRSSRSNTLDMNDFVNPINDRNDDGDVDAYKIISSDFIPRKPVKKNIENSLTEDPELTSQINPFRDLGVYHPPPLKSAFHLGGYGSLRLRKNPYYCDVVDLGNIRNEDKWMNHKFYATDYPWPFIRNFLNDTFEQTTVLPKYSDRVHTQDLSYDTVMFFLLRYNFNYLPHMGVGHLCQTQIYGWVPGLQALGWKKGFAECFFDYAKKNEDKPKCLDTESFYPKTYLLDNTEQCEAFFEYLETDRYQNNKAKQPLQFLIKISEGVDEGKGVFLFTQEYEDKLKRQYKNGEKCYSKKNKLLAQRYIPNPLLLDHTHKFDFRIHVLVASPNPVIIYYHDGFLRVSLQEFDIKSQDLKNHLTNVHVSVDIVKATNSKAKAKELLDYQMQYLHQFQDYALREGLTTDPNFLDNYLRPEFKKAIAHIVHMSSDKWMKNSGLFRLMGFDFMIDTNLKLWFIEANMQPQLFKTRPDIWNFVTNMLKDMVDVVYGLLKSRMTRVTKVMKRYMKECMVEGSECDKKAWRNKYYEANKDQMMDQFAPEESNGWKLIIDLGKGEKEGYNGLLDDSCFE